MTLPIGAVVRELVDLLGATTVFVVCALTLRRAT
jgi:hypothetical protein